MSSLSRLNNGSSTCRISGTYKSHAQAYACLNTLDLTQNQHTRLDPTLGPLACTLCFRLGCPRSPHHRIVAQNYLAPATKTWVTDILGDTLVNVATWADDYRSTTAGKFSSGFHYIDAEDNPPSSCSVSYTRDCAGGCIVSAITNYTSRVQSTSLSASERTIALKFIVHFLGDVTQPLHDENKATGGNGISVLRNGATTNLHSVWDTSIPEKYVGGNTVSYATTWGNQIIAKLAPGGAYESSKASWLSCISPSTAQTCSLEWASDANAIVCSYVLKTDPTGQELSGSYYTEALPLVEQQIAKGGIRLAAYLNMIVTGTTGF